MKKILSIIIVVLTVFSLVSCSAGTVEETTVAEDIGVSPVVAVNAEKTAVKPGEEIEITLHVSDAPLTACFDIQVYAESMLEFVGVKNMPSQMILAANKKSEGGEEFVVVRGIVADTCDVLDDDICVITYKVKKDAPKGTVINITTRAPEYKVGMDESGNDILAVDCETKGLVLEVL